MPRWFKEIVVLLGFSDRWTCELSVGEGLVDHHGYTDSADTSNAPFHNCKRCGKRFFI